MRTVLSLDLKFKTIILLCMFLFVGPQVAAAELPITYVDHTWLGGVDALLIDANSRGEYFVLQVGYSSGRSRPGFIIKLNNDLSEVKRWDIPFIGTNFYNEIAVDHEDNVWISSTRVLGGRKLFLKFDSDGNYIDYLLFKNYKLAAGVHRDFLFDEIGNLYFMHKSYVRYPTSSHFSTLYKVNPSTGGIINEWVVPVGGPHNWQAGLAMNSNGELIYGVIGSSVIYKFDPVTEQTELFNHACGHWSVEGVYAMAIDDNDNLFITTYSYELCMYDKDGNFVGSGYLGVPGLSLGGTTFRDELVFATKKGYVIKYSLGISNTAPVADAGADITAECTGANGVSVILDGSQSSDPDGDALTYTWTGPFGTATGVSPTVTLPLGTHTITLTVDDGNGGIDSDTVVVEVADTTPPEITISDISDGETYALGLVPEASYDVFDTCSGVAASSAMLMGGDGLGLGTFTYTVTATDNAGNTGKESATYDVIATAEGLTTLIQQMVADGLIARQMENSLLQQLSNADLGAMINHIEAQRGKKISNEAADILINAIQYMLNN